MFVPPQAPPGAGPLGKPTRTTGGCIYTLNGFPSKENSYGMVPIATVFICTYENSYSGPGTAFCGQSATIEAGYWALFAYHCTNSAHQYLTWQGWKDIFQDRTLLHLYQFLRQSSRPHGSQTGRKIGNTGRTMMGRTLFCRIWHHTSPISRMMR